MLTLPVRGVLMEEFDKRWIIRSLSREGYLGALKARKKMTDLGVTGARVSEKGPVVNHSRTRIREGVATMESSKGHHSLRLQREVDNEVQGKQEKSSWLPIWLE